MVHTDNWIELDGNNIEADYFDSGMDGVWHAIIKTSKGYNPVSLNINVDENAGIGKLIIKSMPDDPYAYTESWQSFDITEIEVKGKKLIYLLQKQALQLC